MNTHNKITPFLWFDKDMSSILAYYAGVFKDFEIVKREKMSETPSGDVEIVTVRFFDNTYNFMTASPMFRFNEAISFVIDCDGQEEVDYYWDYFVKDGAESMCGWCKDKYGVSWQIVPKQMYELMSLKDKEVSNFAMQKMLHMKKIVIADLKR